ncbi:hypothetical protein [Yersinia enterocolitica]|uniref:hypothetical protein n=1 Tax=Yersinia enterocolitica TaxID=630 RepID=UPI0028BC4222|nr:hypothetical protein [Yersinia enterocolitica]HEN3579743.1 hypothetical protein [Yersinia enterocolitica]HEN3636873.1 hypothetical protein [Yersinia enterocolitica]
MARRKELAGIASGLIGSFNSRNNDVCGYWAIGQLKSLATKQSLEAITFSLLSTEAVSDSYLIGKVTRNYSAKLYALLKSQCLPANWVLNAAITIQFSGVTPSQSEVFRHSLGEFYRCSCELIDDNGKSYTASDYGFCQPHSSHKEFKRFTE